MRKPTRNLNESRQILLIEDNEGDALLIRKRLSVITDFVYEVTHCEDLVDALALIEKNVFDLILLDLNLHGSERLQTVKRVSAVTDAAIIVLTSVYDEELALRAVEIGIQEFYSKDDIGNKQFINALKFAMERQKAKNKLHNLAFRDEVTGLPNKNALIDKVKTTLEFANQSASVCAIHIVQINNIKEIVMSHGLHVAEACLKTVAGKLYGLFEDDKYFARLDSDSFALLQSEIDHQGHVLYTARRMQESLGNTVAVMGYDLPVTCNIGIALFPDHGTNWEALYYHASVALEESCQDGSECCRVYRIGD